MAKRPLERPEESILREMILKAVGQQKPPQTVRDLRKHLTGPFKLPEEALLEIVNGLVKEGNLFAWPAKGKGKPRYWDKEPASFISGTIIDRLSEKPLTAVALNRLLVKALFGIPKKEIEKGIQALTLQGSIRHHPRFGMLKAKLGLRPPDPQPYLFKVRKEMEQVYKMLGPTGVSREEIQKAFFDGAGLPPDPPGQSEAYPRKELEEEILSKMVEVEPQAPYGALVSLRNLRRSLGLAKEVFDRAIIDLAKNKRIILHQHSFPQGLSIEEQQSLVEDQKGHSYVGAVLVNP